MTAKRAERDHDAIRTQVYMDNSVLSSKDIIPIIFTTTGQFTVIDGFIIHLKARPELINDLKSNHAKNVLNPGGWFTLRNTYNPTSCKTIEFINSNFYISKNEILFCIMKSSVMYVEFTERNGSFKCKRTSRQHATHQAIQLPIERGDRKIIKYLVNIKTISPPNFDPNDLLAQQQIEITAMESVINEAVQHVYKSKPTLQNYNLKGFETPDVFFVPSSIISKVKRFPISMITIKELLQKEEEYKTTQLNQLRDELSSIINKHNTVKISQLKSYFASNPTEFNIDTKLFETICEKCYVNSKNNLNTLSNNIFPQLVNNWVQSTTNEKNKVQSISDSYCIIDQFLVSIKQKRIVNNTDDDDFKNLTTTVERNKLRHAKLVEWNTIYLSTNPVVSLSEELFKLVTNEPVEFIEDENGNIWNYFADIKGTKKAFDTISIDCGDFGWKHIILKTPDITTHGKPSKTEKYTRFYIENLIKNHDFNENSKQLINDILEFASYAKQQAVYTKLFNEVIQLFKKSQLG
ncbi:hypothetical protein C6P44_003619 [Monosporozyma unispora]|nr:hypothetical protein C6P44_003619 [Kazachstania unispora]